MAFARSVWEDLDIGRSFTKARSGHPELDRVGNNLFIFSFKSMDEGRYIPHQVKEVWAFSESGERRLIRDIDAPIGMDDVAFYRLYTVTEDVHEHKTYNSSVLVLLMEYPSRDYLERVNASLVNNKS